MVPGRNLVEPIARRTFLRSAGLGLGGLALADLMGLTPSALAQSVSNGIFGTGHVAARAKRVILLHQMGAVSQVDTFDYKPTLMERHGEEIPDSVRNRVRISAMSNAQASFPLVRPLAEFSQAGQSGAWVSDLLPSTREIVDDLCFIKTLHTEHVNHDPGAKFLHTGYQLSGRPSMGAWLDYALGSDNANLPSFVAMVSAGTPAGQGVDGGIFGSGFLPSHHQGVLFSPGEQPVPYISNPEGVTLQERREQLDLVNALARLQHDASGDPEIPSKIAQYEMAYRMQTAVPEVADLASEPQHVLDMYGPNVLQPGSFARNCLLARRLVERDVKFVSLINTGWDHHNGIAESHPEDCLLVDQPSAGLVKDLKQRGLLEDTLVIWGSEFGRTAFAQGALNVDFGRDHHGGCFTCWMAGGGVNAGYTHGETDEFSYNIVRDPVSIHDLHATVMYLLGIDHERLTFRYQGRDFRLTDVHGEVVEALLA